MKKVINITLGSIVFAIETDAYDALEVYLKSIKDAYMHSDDYQEIAEDIERALAEKFIARKKNEKIAITRTDVEHVTSEIGSASEFTEGEASEPKTSSGKKRLYRNTDDAILGGVASGIASYFEIDPVIVRFIFFISIFFNGIGIVVYLVLWLIVPPAITTSDKYAMRGEKVTISHITERVKKKIHEIDDIQQAKGIWEKIRSFLTKFFALLGTVLKLIFNALRACLGVILVTIGALGIATVTIGTVGLATGSALFVFDPFGQEIISSLMVYSFDGLLILLGTALFGLIPCIFLIIAGMSTFQKKNKFTMGSTISLFILWVVAILVVSVIGAKYIPEIIEHEWEEPRFHTCTADAKLCPDGSAVGRTGPNCEFAACPDIEPEPLPNDVGMEFPTI